MAWIESHTVLIRHRKLLQLAISLSLRPVEVLGHLTALWHTVLEQQEDGNLTDWPDEMIAQAASFKGDPRLFVAELQAKKWLDGKIIHDWLDYAGRYLSNKYRNSNPKRLQAIYRIHKVRLKTVQRQSKDSPEPDRLPDLPTLPDLPEIQKTLKPYGEFKKVKLSEEQFIKLGQRLGAQNRDELITDLDTHVEAKGYKYKSAYATILNWHKRRPKKVEPQKPISFNKPEEERLPPEDLVSQEDVKQLLGSIGKGLK